MGPEQGIGKRAVGVVDERGEGDGVAVGGVGGGVFVRVEAGLEGKEFLFEGWDGNGEGGGGGWARREGVGEDGVEGRYIGEVGGEGGGVLVEGR